MTQDVIISFLIPLRPRDGSDSWDIACRLLRQTLHSLQNQRDERFIAVVAGHDKPEWFDSLDDTRITFHTVDFGDRALKRGPTIDRMWKAAFAAMRAAPANPRYHMTLDADDLLHRELVAFVAEQDHPVIVLDRGWEFDLAFNRILPRKDLSHRCGSTVIYRTKDLPLPAGNGWDEWNRMPTVTLGHNCVKEFAAERSLPILTPSQRLVAYLQGHGENLSRKKAIDYNLRPHRRKLAFYLLGRTPGRAFKRDFGLHS